MNIYVNAAAGFDGDGSKEHPYSKISQAAEMAQPGDFVMVEPGIYREYVNPAFGGTEERRITYKSTKEKGAIITGAEVVKGRIEGRQPQWPRCKYPKRTETVYVPQERRDELANMGFTDFKLQGRNRKPQEVVEFLIKNILSDKGRSAFKDDLRQVYRDALTLSFMLVTPDVLIAIPKSSSGSRA